MFILRATLVPLVIANALHVNVLIISEDEQGFSSEVIYTNAGNDVVGEILIYKSLDHDDGITPKSKPSKYPLGCGNINDQSKATAGSSSDIHQLPEYETSGSKTAPACHEVCRLGQGCFNPTPASDPKENLSSSGGSENKIRQIPSTTVTASVNINGNTAPHDSSDHDDSLTGSLANTGREPVEDYIYQLKKYRNTNPKNCIIGHLNMNSIRYKFDAVQCLLQGGLLDIFAISEPKLDESFPLAQFKVNDFSLHRKDRNKHGGGILFFMRSDIPHRRRYDLEPETSHGIEIMVIETRLYEAQKWFLVSLYKPPNVKDWIFEIIFTDICQSLEKESPHWFVMGDINLDMNFANSLCDVSMVFNLTNYKKFD